VILGRRSGLINEWRERWAPPTHPRTPARTRSERINAHHALATCRDDLPRKLERLLERPHRERRGRVQPQSFGDHGLAEDQLLNGLVRRIGVLTLRVSAPTLRFPVPSLTSLRRSSQMYANCVSPHCDYCVCVYVCECASVCVCVCVDGCACACVCVQYVGPARLTEHGLDFHQRLPLHLGVPRDQVEHVRQRDARRVEPAAELFFTVTERDASLADISGGGRCAEEECARNERTRRTAA
jgi:hypothetical protein